MKNFQESQYESSFWNNDSMCSFFLAIIATYAAMMQGHTNYTLLGHTHGYCCYDYTRASEQDQEGSLGLEWKILLPSFTNFMWWN